MEGEEEEGRGEGEGEGGKEKGRGRGGGKEKGRGREGDEIQYLTSVRENFEHPLANINGSHGCSVSNIKPDG